MVAFLFSSLSAIPRRTGIGKCWFLKTGENWSTHSKPSLSKVKKHHTLNSHTALVSATLSGPVLFLEECGLISRIVGAEGGRGPTLAHVHGNSKLYFNESSTRNT